MEPEKIKMQEVSLLFEPTTKTEMAGIKPQVSLVVDTPAPPVHPQM